MSMKRNGLILVFVLSVLILVPSFALAGSPLEIGVTSDEWTYQAISDLGRGREIPGFAIPKELNRNQGALLVARLLQHLSGEDHLESRRFGVSKNVYLDSMIFNYNQKVTPERELSPVQVELLYRLVLEFRPELEILGYAIQDFNFMSIQGWQQSLDGLFAKRPLLYSEQALAAARRLEEEKKLQVQTETVAIPTTTEELPEALAKAFAPRNLWVGNFSSQSRTLPGSSSFLVQEPNVDVPTGIQIGNLEVSGGLRPVQSGLQPAENAPAVEGGAGYGVSMKLGDLAVNTAFDHMVTDQSQTKKVTSTSIDFSLDWANLFTLSGGYKQLEIPSDPEWEEVSPLVTSLGVEVPITRGKVHLGMTQEWPKLLDLEGEKDSAAKNTAELALSYQFENETSLRFNYRFIDFSSVEHGASAEFSIKF